MRLSLRPRAPRSLRDVQPNSRWRCDLDVLPGLQEEAATTVDALIVGYQSACNRAGGQPAFG